jgi:putative FmdB family regulatory protein
MEPLYLGFSHFNKAFEPESYLWYNIFKLSNVWNGGSDMPTYTYLCEKCGVAFEVFASVQKKETGWHPACPKCGSPQTRQTYQSIATLVGTRKPQTGGSCCTPREG